LSSVDHFPNTQHNYFSSNPKNDLFPIEIFNFGQASQSNSFLEINQSTNQPIDQETNIQLFHSNYFGREQQNATS